MDASRLLHLSAAIVCALLLGAGDARPEEAPPQARHINPQRLQATLEKLSEFGRNPEGGVTRLGFSQADLDARAYVTSLMKDAHLEVRVDPAGNIFGRRAGSEQLPTLLFGSHIDSVPTAAISTDRWAASARSRSSARSMTPSSPRVTRSRS
jgi:N-carbamoyl-L-amino-acid hydrolase